MLRGPDATGLPRTGRELTCLPSRYSRAYDPSYVPARCVQPLVEYRAPVVMVRILSSTPTIRPGF
jgi:hypothetical protein